MLHVAIYIKLLSANNEIVTFKGTYLPTTSPLRVFLLPEGGETMQEDTYIELRLKLQKKWIIAKLWLVKVGTLYF